MADGLAREGWDKDLRDGKAREDAFVHTLLGDKVEVKSDGIARRTHRVFIEYAQRSKRDGRWRPSGIVVSTAHRWAIEVAPGCWVIVPRVHLAAVVQRLWRERPDLRKEGGDYNGYRGVLVPLDELLWGEVTEHDLHVVTWREASQ